MYDSKLDIKVFQHVHTSVEQTKRRLLVLEGHNLIAEARPKY